MSRMPVTVSVVSPLARNPRSFSLPPIKLGDTPPVPQGVIKHGCAHAKISGVEGEELRRLTRLISSGTPLAFFFSGGLFRRMVKTGLCDFCWCEWYSLAGLVVY